jgi:hypothetical protein
LSQDEQVPEKQVFDMQSESREQLFPSQNDPTERLEHEEHLAYMQVFELQSLS